MSGPRNRGILDAWSQRKARVRAEEEALARRKAALRDARARERCDAEHAGRSDAEILAALGLPDPDSLSAGDDFAAFMRAAIPERLRQRALRRLWGTDPLLANVDGLVDYGEDFTRSESAWRAVESIWQAGQERLEERRARDVHRAQALAGNDPAPGEPPGETPGARPGEISDETGEARNDDTGGQGKPAGCNPTIPTHHGARAIATEFGTAGPTTDPAPLERGAPTPPRTRRPTRRRMRFAFTPSTEMDSTSR